MASSDTQDNRLLERGLRQGDLNPKEVEKEIAALPDLSESRGRPSDDDVEKFRDELEVEKTARDERVQRFLEEGPAPVIRPDPVPLDESDL
jgi:hypothetical protein